MKVLRFKLYAYRNRLVPMFVLVMIPWLAVAPWAPWWANSVAMPLLFICAALLFVHVLPTPSMTPRAADEGKLSEADIARMRANPEQNAQDLLNDADRVAVAVPAVQESLRSGSVSAGYSRAKLMVSLRVADAGW